MLDGSVNQPSPSAAVPMPSDLRVISVAVRVSKTKNKHDIPRDQLVVITGLSGSGKAACSTISHAEGQRLR